MGWLNRFEDGPRGPDGDGRGVLVALTDSRHDLIEMALPEHQETELAIIVTLSVEEQKFLALNLQRITIAASS
ncbi:MULTISPECIES: hypothetical protein [unclassified Cryobacterium]|uniref:hypothetical protein n=1 Tax=unclassified Cryobacterium TaxID=2649013 RepID=UPI000CE4C2CB|nr:MULTISPECIES: hypothetical protein [unclassified Cryobacterium]